jgi:hypothetical protein
MKSKLPLRVLFALEPARVGSEHCLVVSLLGIRPDPGEFLYSLLHPGAADFEAPRQVIRGKTY